MSDIIKTRKQSLDRFIAALKRQIGQQSDIMDNYMEDYLLKRQKLMQKYFEIRCLETREKSEIGKMLVYTYEELVSSIKNQIKDGPCKDIVERLKEEVLSKITLQSVQLLATGKKPVFGNLNE